MRDRTKRPIMGRIVGSLADNFVITSVDWYSEDVGAIMDQIAEGARVLGCQEGRDFWLVRDRK